MTTHQATAINLHMEEERPAPAVQNPPAATARDRVDLYTIYWDGEGVTGHTANWRREAGYGADGWSERVGTNGGFFVAHVWASDLSNAIEQGRASLPQ